MKGVGLQDRGIGKGGGCELDMERRTSDAICREAREQSRGVERRFIVGEKEEGRCSKVVSENKHFASRDETATRPNESEGLQPQMRAS